MSRRTRTKPLSFLPLLLGLGACAAADPNVDLSEFERYFDQELVDSEKAKAQRDKERNEFDRVLVQIDQAIDSYVRALNHRGIPSQDLKVEQLDRLLRQLVNGKSPDVARPSNPNRPKQLIALASGSPHERRQAIALAALGFSDHSQAMTVMVQGAQLDNPVLVDSAVLGLALLKDPRTPPGVIAAIAENPNYHEEGRINAAWALYTVQQNSLKAAQITPVWLRLLSGNDDVHPGIVGTAVRGLGATRNPEHAPVVARFLRHPTPRVRLNATIALGRMNAQGMHEQLIELLEPGETAQNVRLGARKALQALAGGTDRGYDPELWRREFDRRRQRQR